MVVRTFLSVLADARPRSWLLMVGGWCRSWAFVVVDRAWWWGCQCLRTSVPFRGSSRSAAGVVPGHSSPFCVVVSGRRLCRAGVGAVFACRPWVWSLGDVAWSLSVAFLVWWSLVEERINVTSCDIPITFNVRSQYADVNFKVCLECYATKVCNVCFLH